MNDKTDRIDEDFSLSIYENSGEDVGRVKDPIIAAEMAKIMDSYQTKFLGLIPAWQSRIEKGEKLAEAHVRNGEAIHYEKLPQAVQRAIVDSQKLEDQKPKIEQARWTQYDDGIDVFAIDFSVTYPSPGMARGPEGREYPVVRHLLRKTRHIYVTRDNIIIDSQQINIGVENVTNLNLER